MKYESRIQIAVDIMDIVAVALFNSKDSLIKKTRLFAVDSSMKQFNVILGPTPYTRYSLLYHDCVDTCRHHTLSYLARANLNRFSNRFMSWMHTG